MATPITWMGVDGGPWPADVTVAAPSLPAGITWMSAEGESGPDDAGIFGGGGGGPEPASATLLLRRTRGDD